jgi:hypothetical protein
VASLAAVPQLRAVIVEFLQSGAVRIQFAATATPTPAATPSGTAPATARPSATPLPSLLKLAGQTTLAEARQQVRFAIRLPTHPADLGEPDLVFVQDLDGSAVVLVWLDPTQADQVRLSLHVLTSESFAVKKLLDDPSRATHTTVNGQDAYWVEGPYMLEMRSGNWEFTRLIEGHVLVWTEGDLTYRLETDVPLEEAVKIAESLQ